MIGMTIVAKGAGCVTWISDGDDDNLYLPKGVVAIILSWILSPFLSALIASGMFVTIRSLVLRAKDSFTKVGRADAHAISNADGLPCACREEMRVLSTSLLPLLSRRRASTRCSSLWR
jgi:phosphate/sulfate permease